MIAPTPPAPPTAPPVPADAPYVDHAHWILGNSESLDAEQRADIWDAFHQSRDAREFADKVAQYPAPQEVKDALMQAKRVTNSEISPVDKAISALNQMATVGPEALTLAEKYPGILKKLTGTE